MAEKDGVRKDVKIFLVSYLKKEKQWERDYCNESQADSN